MISKSLKFLRLVFLALPIFLLVVFLWAQWPMRVFASGNPRLINDMGQIAFAYFWVMAFAIACLSQSHLQISNNAAPTKKGRRAWTGFVLSLPWAIFLVYSAWPLLINSWHENEKFPDTECIIIHKHHLEFAVHHEKEHLIGIFQCKLIEIGEQEFKKKFNDLMKLK